MSDVVDEHEAEGPPPVEPPHGIPPVAIPILALFGMLILVFSASRILLAVSHAAASGIALFLALNILVGAALVSAGRWVRNRPASFPLIVLAGVLFVAGGAVAMAIEAGQEEEPHGVAVAIAAQGVAFVQTDVTVPSGEPLAIEFDNQDAGIDHNIHIFQGQDATGTSVFSGAVFPGVATQTYEVPALQPGAYFFQCDVHPNMVGTITAEEGAEVSGGAGGPQPAPGETGAGGGIPTPEPTPTGGEPGATDADLTAVDLAFDPQELTVEVAGGEVSLVFENLDEGQAHNIVVLDSSDDSGEPIFEGEIITGPDSIEYSFEAPPPDDYYFYCQVHPQMTGTLTVE